MNRGINFIKSELFIPEKFHRGTERHISKANCFLVRIINGTTFESIFDDQSVISIEDVAVAPSNPDILWIGAGEGNNSRSSYWGDGVYKLNKKFKILPMPGLE